MRGAILMAVVAATFGGIGCGDGDSNRPPYATLASCPAAGWLPTGPLRTDTILGPQAMAWAEGLLYQAYQSLPATHTSGIAVAPADGGDPTVIVDDDWATSLWIEGDNLLYTHDDRLMQVPRAGGAKAMVLAGGVVTLAPNVPESMVTYPALAALDSAYFYFTTWGYADGRLVRGWRIPRAGGDVEALGLVPVTLTTGVAIASDGLLIGGDAPEGSPALWAAGVATGGSVRMLDPITYWLAGVDAGGAVWNAIRHVNSELDERFEVMVSPVDGSPARPLSAGLPVEFIADKLISDGQGGRFISGLEKFEDLTTHRSVFFVDGNGVTVRLGCDPSSDIPGIESAALGADALYLAVNYFDGLGWTIVKVPRDPAAPR
jgi:hypothetical protein